MTTAVLEEAPKITVLEESPKSKAPKLQIMSDFLDEMVAFCPSCMAMETLSFGDDGLMPTRRFRQIGNRIFHNCGSIRPCRLYRSF